MATASAVYLQRDNLSATITTSDAALTMVYCSREIADVTCQPTSAAAGYVQPTGATQAGAVATSAIEVGALGTATLGPQDCGIGAGNAWSFGVARAAVGTVWRLNASLR